jgi:predicted RNase H-like HicB family nuclease
MTELLFVVEEDPTGGFTARAVGHSLFTQADSHDELVSNIREAIDAHFEPPNLPKLIRLHFVRDEVLAL